MDQAGAANEAAANLEAQSIFRAADLIAAERVRQINDALTRYNVDYRVLPWRGYPYRRGGGIGRSAKQCATPRKHHAGRERSIGPAEQTIGDYLEGQETIRAGTASLDAARTLGEIRADICALRAVAAVARTMLGIAGGGLAAGGGVAVRPRLGCGALQSSFIGSRRACETYGTRARRRCIRDPCRERDRCPSRRRRRIFRVDPSPETAALFCLGVTQ